MRRLAPLPGKFAESKNIIHTASELIDSNIIYNLIHDRSLFGRKKIMMLQIMMLGRILTE